MSNIVRVYTKAIGKPLEEKVYTITKITDKVLYYDVKGKKYFSKNKVGIILPLPKASGGEGYSVIIPNILDTLPAIDSKNYNDRAQELMCTLAKMSNEILENKRQALRKLEELEKKYTNTDTWSEADPFTYPETNTGEINVACVSVDNDDEIIHYCIVGEFTDKDSVDLSVVSELEGTSILNKITIEIINPYLERLYIADAKNLTDKNNETLDRYFSPEKGSMRIYDIVHAQLKSGYTVPYLLSKNVECKSVSEGVTTI